MGEREKGTLDPMLDSKGPFPLPDIDTQTHLGTLADSDTLVGTERKESMYLKELATKFPYSRDARCTSMPINQ